MVWSVGDKIKTSAWCLSGRPKEREGKVGQNSVGVKQSQQTSSDSITQGGIDPNGNNLWMLDKAKPCYPQMQKW